MRSFFRPLTKRDAMIAAVVVGLVIVYLVVSFIKDLMSGLTFEEMKTEIILIAFAGFLEWGMLQIAISKDKDDEDGSGDDQTD